MVRHVPCRLVSWSGSINYRQRSVPRRLVWCKGLWILLVRKALFVRVLF